MAKRKLINILKITKKGSVFFLFLLLLWFSGCLHTEQHKIKNIAVLYFPGDVNSPHTGCNYIFSYSLSIDTNITSRTVLSKINKLVSTLQIKKKNVFDVQTTIYCRLIYENGDTSNLYLGELSGICLDKQIMQENLKLHRLIKEQIGYYKYFKEKDLKIVKRIEEEVQLTNE